MSSDITEFYSETKIECQESDCRIISGEVLANHSIKFVPDASAVDVCSIENRFSVVITDEFGDVTHNYDVEYIYGQLTILPRVIKVITHSASHTYDGKAFSYQEYNIDPKNGLLEGHEAVVTFSPLSTRVDVGVVENRISTITITNKAGDVVTPNYKIEYSEIGEIIVTPRPLTIRTPDASKYYDGTPLTTDRDSWELVSVTQPAEGHKLEAAVSGTITEIGERDNVLAEVRITDTATGENVTRNYAITEQLGTLMIKGNSSTTPGVSGPGDGTSGGGTTSGDGTASGGGSGSGGAIDSSGDLGGGSNGGNSAGDDAVCLRVYSTKSGPVYLRMKSFGNFSAASKSWTEATSYGVLLDGKYSYNYLSGVALKNTGIESARIEIENLMAGQYFVPYFPDMYDESTYDIQKSDVLYTGDSSDVYSLYYYLYSGYYIGINANLGEYSDEELEYRAFVYENYGQNNDRALDEYMLEIIEINGFNAASDTIIADVATYIQNAATYNPDYDTKIDYASNPIIAFLEAQEGVCRHYASAATALYRALGIPARYTIGFAGFTEAGQWTEITGKQAHAWTEVYIDGIGWLPIEVTGSPDDQNGGGGSGAGGIGGIEGSGDTGGNGGNGDTGGNGGNGGTGGNGGNGGTGGNGGNGGTGGNGGNTEDQTKRLKIGPKTTYHKYDGELAYPENVVTGLSALVKEGYYYTVTVEKVGAATNLPGIYETKVTSFVLYDKTGKDVTSQYSINFSVGYMQIYIRELTVYTEESEKEYDGTPLTSNGYSVEGSLMSGHIVKSVVCTGSQIKVGKSTNNFAISIVDDQGVDVTSHYKINRECGTLSVTPRTITVTANSNSKVYDGTALEDKGYTVECDIDGYSVEVIVVGSQTNIGRSDNVIQKVVVRDSHGRDVTLNFSIVCINGKLTVTPR